MAMTPFPPPPEYVGNYRLDTILNLDDGDHTIEVFFRDVAGNESPADDDDSSTLPSIRKDRASRT